MTNSGTGKTLISAFDYRIFRKANSGKKNRLLFVVHREEILKQSRDVFQAVLKDPNFGELFVELLLKEERITLLIRLIGM